MKTSDLLLLDIKDAILELATTKKTDDSITWLCRHYTLISNALPVVLFLEAVDIPVTPVHLWGINELDDLITSTIKSHGLNFDFVSQELQRSLRAVPGYKIDDMGKQSPSTIEHHQYIIMSAKHLRDAVRATKDGLI